MTPEVRRSALRMAAKAALVATLGCSGANTAAPAPSNAAQTPDPASSSRAAAPVACDTYLAGLATAKIEELPASDPLKSRPGVYGAFADMAARDAARTQECCTDEVTKNQASSKYRWECCSALPAGTDVGTACTPWGPPCPPEMV